MKTRIKALRQHLQYSQTEFGKMCGVSLSAVQKWESGENAPTSSIISLIASKTDVNEVWLRTGVGDMFRQRTREDEISAFLGKLVGGNCTDFQRRFVSVLARMSPEEWELLERKIDELAGK